MRCRFVTKAVHTRVGDKYMDCTIIGIRDENGRFRIHPVSAFVLKEYFGRQSTTINQAASYVCSFLNWCINNCSDLRNITEADISSYLSEEAITKRLKRKTILHKKTFLVRFLYFLVKNGVVTSIKRSDLVTDRIYRNSVVLHADIQVTAPINAFTPDYVVKVKTIEPQYFYLFMNVAVKTCPDIAPMSLS